MNQKTLIGVAALMVVIVCIVFKACIINQG